VTQTQTNFVENSLGSRIAYTIFRGLAVLLTRAVTRVHIDGQENLPKAGAYVIAPVHRSYVDTPIVACISRRRIRFMGKEEVWKHRSVGWLVSVLGAFPVSRGTADREALKRCVTVLDNGEPLVLFPEGERKDGPLIQPLFAGAVYIAARAGVPIIPIGIGGSARVMPRHAKMIHPQKVYVVIGEPIHVEVAKSGRASRQAVTDTTDQLSVELQRLFDIAQSRVG
jgi:1-acyl-sn-glycerol-3-phosphate acyltransferase